MLSFPPSCSGLRHALHDIARPHYFKSNTVPAHVPLPLFLCHHGITRSGPRCAHKRKSCPTSAPLKLSVFRLGCLCFKLFFTRYVEPSWFSEFVSRFQMSCSDGALLSPVRGTSRRPPLVASESLLRSISREDADIATPDLSPRSARIVTADLQVPTSTYEYILVQTVLYAFKKKCKKDLNQQTNSFIDC